MKLGAMEVEVGVSEPSAPTPDVARMRNGQVQGPMAGGETLLVPVYPLSSRKHVCDKLSSAVVIVILYISLLGGNRRLKFVVLCFVWSVRTFLQHNFHQTKY